MSRINTVFQQFSFEDSRVDDSAFHFHSEMKTTCKSMACTKLLLDFTCNAFNGECVLLGLEINKRVVYNSFIWVGSSWLKTYLPFVLQQLAYMASIKEFF